MQHYNTNINFAFICRKKNKNKNEFSALLRNTNNKTYIQMKDFFFYLKKNRFFFYRNVVIDSAKNI